MIQDLIKGTLNRFSSLKPYGSNGKSGSDNGSIRDLQKSLNGINEVLKKLSSSSEKDFLAIGSQLQDIYSRSTTMAELGASVVRTMTGEDITKAIEGLSTILEELKGHLETSEGGFDKISQGLADYQKTLKEVFSYLEKFRTLVLNLDMLGFFTRVENAHILKGDTGFDSLTDDVKALSRRIFEKSTQIQSKSGNLSSLISQALIEFLAFKKSHKNHAMTMLNRSVMNHEILVKKHRSATETAHRILSKSTQIKEKVGNIVSSLQFHDITSQQIGHVSEVIESLQESVGFNTLSDAEKTGLISEVCALQISQLGNSRNGVCTAVESVIESMNKIGLGIQDLLDETRKVSWASDIEGLSFMEELDFGISTVIECLDENITEQTGLTNTMSSVSSMVSEMSVFVGEIENLGLNLQLIALNARIKAAHMGKEGAALDTISGSIYELSKDSRTDTSVLSHMLSSVVDIAKQFDSNLENMHRGQEKGVGNLVENLKALLSSLHETNDSVFTTLIEMNAMGESLVEGIGEIASGINVHRETQDTINDVMGEFDAVRCKAKGMHPYEKRSKSSTLMDELQKYYTMESEYKIHADHAEIKGAAGTSAASKGMASEYGDNVELF